MKHLFIHVVDQGMLIELSVNNQSQPLISKCNIRMHEFAAYVADYDASDSKVNPVFYMPGS